MRAMISTISLGLALGGACNTTTSGDEGNIAFTPRDCGLYLGCAIDDGLAVGGAALLQIAGTGGVSTVGVSLDVSDPQTASIVPVADVGGDATWEILGLSEGSTRVVAYDAADVELDSIRIDVDYADGLTLDSYLNTAVGPNITDPGYDQVWTMNAGQNYAFSLRGYVGTDPSASDGEIMGRFVVTTTVDQELVPYVNTGESRLDEGVIRIDGAPTGQYEVSFDAGVAGALTALFDVQ